MVDGESIKTSPMTASYKFPFLVPPYTPSFYTKTFVPSTLNTTSAKFPSLPLVNSDSFPWVRAGMVM